MVAAGEEEEGTRHVASSRAALRPASVYRDAARLQEVGGRQGRLYRYRIAVLQTIRKKYVDLRYITA